ncbi:MAG: putative potassium uptake protein TrkA [Bacteroidetes bacterium]|nr:putative potassium uptake protein TrkA [Bacteroidota bacterium]
MNWINNLLSSGNIPYTILVLAFVIAVGIILGKVKIAGVSLGITLVLFVGIAVSHFGFTIDHKILSFVKDFGLILFIYAVGLQVGPGFFASFKKGGIKLNLLASGIVLLGIITTIIIHYITNIPMPTMVGIMSGAVTNTPGLGAAQETFSSINHGANNSSIALGYAIAYPLGVLGIIFSIIILRRIFKVDFDKENEDLIKQDEDNLDSVYTLSLEVKNPSLFGKSIKTISELIDKKLIISRILHSNTGRIEIASSKSVLGENDKVFVITSPRDKDSIISFIGNVIDITREQWTKLDSELISRRILVTKSEINGKTLAQLNLRNKLGITITRVNRSGIDLIALPSLALQIGDRVNILGSNESISTAEKILGNQLKRLNEPNIIPIFIGIFLGVLLGSMPFAFPFMPQPVKLGLAGGPLIVAILISIFGAKFKLVTYTTMSANLMLREIGICLFLACIGLGAGEGFVETIINGEGLKWMGLGVIITVLPLIIIGIIGRKVFKINYFSLMGLIAGSTTDSPALSYSINATGNDMPTISYASVYPLAMFLRVISAQALIIFFL